MKIVYCISAMFKSGGIERVIANKVNYLVNHGYEAVSSLRIRPVVLTSSLLMSV